MNPQAQQAQYTEDEIDLRAYIQVLVKYWWFIVGAAMVAAVVAVVMGLGGAPVYEARAAVIITQSKAELTLEPKFKIVGGGLTGLGGDAAALRSALAGLVTNATVASEVLASLGDGLSPELHDLGRLMTMVDGEVVHGNLIQITVRSSSPVTASLVANAWGAEYESYVNQLYGGGEADSVATIGAQAGEARAAYEVAEEALVEFTGESRIAELTRLIEEKQEIIKSLQAAKQKALAAKLETLASYYQTRLKLERLLQDAKGLYAQVSQGGVAGSATNGLALLLLKAQAFASSEDLPGGFELRLDGISDFDVGTEPQLADLRALIAVLEMRIEQLDAAIDSQSRELLSNQWYDLLAAGEVPADNPLASIGTQVTQDLLQLSDLGSFPGSAAASQELGQALGSLEEEVRGLQAQLEAEQARERELKRARDLAWETYTTVARKVAEVNVAASVATTLVRFASPAVQPSAPIPGKTLQNVVLAAVAAFVVASGVVVFLHFLNPDFDPKEVFRPLGRGEAS
ncbi:MAG TPA: Wzz/FepE/Etk N-terminal domain-containing protein [Anaerolineae bacterium]|nr:Wzz/FepE/Etk N-terminal domain-containing protein [Anaerolineae bacterium]